MFRFILHTYTNIRLKCDLIYNILKFILDVLKIRGLFFSYFAKFTFSIYSSTNNDNRWESNYLDNLRVLSCLRLLEYIKLNKSRTINIGSSTAKKIARHLFHFVWNKTKRDRLTILMQHHRLEYHIGCLNTRRLAFNSFLFCVSQYLHSFGASVFMISIYGLQKEKTKRTMCHRKFLNIWPSCAQIQNYFNLAKTIFTFSRL